MALSFHDLSYYHITQHNLPAIFHANFIVLNSSLSFLYAYRTFHSIFDRTRLFELDTDASKADRETEIGWLPELVISAPTPFAHSLSTSCLSTTYPTPSSQGFQFSKDQEEVQCDSSGDKPDGVKLNDESYFPCKKRGMLSFSSTGTSICSETFNTQTEVILSLLSGDPEVVDVKDEEEQVLNPLSPGNANTAPLPSSAPLPIRAAEVTEKSFDILVVDDSKLNRKMLCKVLRSKGHVCDEADDGLKAVQKVKERLMRSSAMGKNSFDAILMDFVMPCMDGPIGTSKLDSVYSSLLLIRMIFVAIVLIAFYFFSRSLHSPLTHLYATIILIHYQFSIIISCLNAFAPP